MNKKLFKFYVTYSKPRYDIWNLKRISGETFKADEYTNVKLLARRGVAHEMFYFILIDLPLMNPYKWIVMLNILFKEPVKYEPIIQHLRRMIKPYIQEISKMDIEIATVLRRVPILGHTN